MSRRARLLLVEGAVIYGTCEDQHRQQHTTTEILARGLIPARRATHEHAGARPGLPNQCREPSLPEGTTRPDCCRRHTGRTYQSPPYRFDARVTDLCGRYPTPHASHALRDVSDGYADYYCRVCGLHDANTAIERTCPGTRIYACANGGYWQVAFGRQECTDTFETQARATEHFFARHLEEVAS